MTLALTFQMALSELISEILEKSVPFATLKALPLPKLKAIFNCFSVLNKKQK
jgi:hypothetical protein